MKEKRRVGIYHSRGAPEEDGAGVGYVDVEMGGGGDDVRRGIEERERGRMTE